MIFPTVVPLTYKAKTFWVEIVIKSAVGEFFCNQLSVVFIQNHFQNQKALFYKSR